MDGRNAANIKPKGIEITKPTSLRSALLAAMLALSFLTLASATRAADPPRHPTYYSAQKPILPPMPFNPFPELPVHQLDQWDWVYDDSQVDYEQLAREAAIVAPYSASRPFSPLDDSGPGLKILPISQGQIQLQIVNVPVGQVYDLYQTFELKGNLFTAAQCQKVGSGKNLATFTFSSQAAGSVFYALGDQDTDQDLDAIPDAFEQCVSKTSTSSANCPRDIYEAVITAQSPSGWFRLNDGSYANAVSGHTSLMAGGVGGGFDNDVLANGNSAYLFSQPSANLSLAEDAIGGGTGDPVSQGSFTLLFRALTGHATGKRYLLSQGNSLNNNNALAVYFDGTGAAGALKVAVGNTQVAPQQLREEIILQDLDMARGAWYYLAVTCDEARGNNQVRWYLGRVGSGTLQSGSFTLATSGTVFGDGGTITVGNKGGSTISAYQSPGNGYIDQVAFWKRELAADEIAAQFNRLTALFQGPSAVFDLTRWELT